MGKARLTGPLAARRSALLLTGGFALLLLLGWVAGEALELWLSRPDAYLAGLLVAAAPEPAHWVIGLTWLGSVAVLIPLALTGCAVLWVAGRLGDAAFLAIALAGAIALTYLVKDLVDRSRPTLHLVRTASSSFPSAHSADSLAAYGAIAYLVTSRLEARSGRVLCWCLAALVVLAVGWSRLYLGAHYPGDVVGGWAIGAGWLMLSARALPRAAERPLDAGRGTSGQPQSWIKM